MRYTFSLFIIFLLTLSLNTQAQVLEINTVAGNGIYGFYGDGFTATAAEFAGPIGIAFDTAGNYYVVDFYNYRIRKISTDGTITTVAGNGTFGYTGNGSVATSAEIAAHGIAIDKHNNIYFSDPFYSIIRKVTPAGIISTIAGNGTLGFSGDNGPATNAEMTMPYGLAFDAAGNLFIADAGNHAIRKVNITTGIITTVAGTGTGGYTGNLGKAIFAQLDSPYAVTFDRIGTMYISDHRNNVVRKVDTAGIITTFAGTFGVYSNTGNGGPAVLATINGPKGLLTDSIRNVYICDADNNVIRKVDTFGNISTIIGVGGSGGVGYSGDLGPALAANIFNPYDIKMDKQGSFYIADANNERIRKVYRSNLGVNTVVKTSLDMYPNPFSDHITVSGLTVSDKVCVYDMAGRQVSDTWTATSATQTFTITDLPAGLYMLRVSDAAGNKKSVSKLVKE